MNFSSMSIEQLVAYFAEIGIAQDQAILYDNNENYNKLYQQMESVDKELRKRGLEARLSLLKLFDHPNVQVRVKAAIRTLAIAPEAARNQLTMIRETQGYPQAADAALILDDFNNGSYVPD